MNIFVKLPLLCLCAILPSKILVAKCYIAMLPKLSFRQVNFITNCCIACSDNFLCDLSKQGVLRNGEVAVKRIKNNHTIDEKVFRREVSSLLNVSHKNIVRFLGFCSHTEHKVFEIEGSRDFIFAEIRERILCFEYINNGSLENYIADELRGLQWDTRYLIIKAICEGLQYLHMNKQIIHMDLKPANILIDNNMVAKITDFGLSRWEGNTQTKSTTRVASPGYTAPEYIEKGKMSVKYDVYSLGIIIIELVTGHRSIPDINNVLRRWSHRWKKSRKETPFKYKQITKLIEIGLLCQEKDPYKRPFISDIMHVINELENTDRQISNEDKSVEQMSPYLEDDMLGIEPLELCFPFELNNQISCSLELTNGTNGFIVFSIQTTSPLSYCIQPCKDTVAPRSKHSVKITLQPLDKVPQDDHTGDFIVRSTKVNESLISEDITEDIFNGEEGTLVDEVNLTITYKAKVPQIDGPHESNVPPAEGKSKTSSNEFIQFVPPELCLPLLPNQRVLSSAKMINTTDQHIGFIICTKKSNSARYIANPSEGILPPLSTQVLLVTRIAEENEQEDTQCIEKFLVCNGIVTADVKASGVLDNMSETKSTGLPIVLTKTSSSISDELIQFDPPELHFPLLRNKKVSSSIKILNLTDYNVGFNTYSRQTNAAWYHTEPPRGILPPRSTQKLMVTRQEKEDASKDEQFNDKYFVWKSIVSEGMEDSDLMDCIADQESQELPIVLDKISSSIPDELIQLDPAELRIPLLLNKRMLFRVNVVNSTDFCVAFHAYWIEKNAPTVPLYIEKGILPPRSTKKVILSWITTEAELEDMEADGDYFVWSRVVTEDVESEDIISYSGEEESKKLPLILNKASPCTSNELIQFDPPELSLPFIPNKPLVFSVNVVNITDYYVGFNGFHLDTNAGWYIIKPDGGVIPPRSSQRLVVRRVPKKKEQEDMQCEDKFLLWSSLVSASVEASDFADYDDDDGCTELPIVYNKTSLCASDELIQFDPPQLPFLFLPNKRVSMLHKFKIVNVTDHSVGFYVWSHEDNSANYVTEPYSGILLPQSTQAIIVRRTLKEEKMEDMQRQDKIFVWNGIVTEGVQVSDVRYWKDGDKELPVVLTLASPCTANELIQFDPPGLSLPFIPNRPLVFSVNIVNSTDYRVGFVPRVWKSNMGSYGSILLHGVMPPRSTQRLVVQRLPNEKERDGMQCEDKFLIWSSLVGEGVEGSDLASFCHGSGDKEVPIVYTKTSLCASDELIQFDPPQLPFPFLPNMRGSMFCLFKIVNVTDHIVGYRTWSHEDNSASYIMEPSAGILQPRSTQAIQVTRTLKENETEDMQCKDKIFVWNGIVTEGVEADDVRPYWKNNDKELPIVLRQ